MARMTSHTEDTALGTSRPRDGQPDDDSTQDAGDLDAVSRASAGAAALANQQLRRTRERMEEQVEVQRERVTGRVRTLGRALKGASSMLEEDDVVAQCLHFASDKVESVAGYVEGMSTAGAAEDLRAVAKDRPAWFFGGAFVLGLALGRFARSTAGSIAASAEQERAVRRAKPRSSTARTRAGQGSAASPRTQPRSGTQRS